MSIINSMTEKEWHAFAVAVQSKMLDAILDSLDEDKQIDAIEMALFGIAFAATLLANDTSATPEQQISVLHDMVDCMVRLEFGNNG
jgi:sulfopyruvate decarboxylase TPP-binding subunit